MSGPGLGRTSGARTPITRRITERLGAEPKPDGGPKSKPSSASAASASPAPQPDSPTGTPKPTVVQSSDALQTVTEDANTRLLTADLQAQLDGAPAPLAQDRAPGFTAETLGNQIVLTRGPGSTGGAPDTPAPTGALETSRAKTDALERDLRAAQEHEREPDLTTARDNLAEHIENEYLPALRGAQTSLGMQLFRATERGQDTTEVRAEYDANAAEIARAQGLLDEARGRPIDAQDAGVLDLGPGFDLENPPASFEGKVIGERGEVLRYSVDASDDLSLGPDGEQMRTLEVSRSVALGVGGEFETGAIGGRGEVFVGRELNYSITIPEDQYQQVLAGEAEFPDPGDLSTLPPGSSVVVRDEGFVGHELEGRYRAFEVGSTHQDGGGSAVGIEVLDDGTVRVMAGPTDVVTNNVALGLGFSRKVEDFEIGAKLELSGGSTRRNTELRFVEIDPNTGGDAYADFLRTGEVPPASATGVGRGGRISTYEFDAAVAIGGEIQAGPFEAGGSLIEGRSANDIQTLIEYNDGTAERRTQLSASQGVTQYVEQSYGPNGELTDERRGMLLDDIDGDFAEAFATVFGTEAQTGTFDAEIQIPPAAYERLRQRAVEANSGALPSQNIVVNALLRNDNPEDFLQDAGLRLADRNAIVDGFLTLHDGGGPLELNAQSFPSS